MALTKVISLRNAADLLDNLADALFPSPSITMEPLNRLLAPRPVSPLDSGPVAGAMRLRLHGITALLWLSVALIVTLHVQRVPQPWSASESVGFLLLVGFAIVYAAAAFLPARQREGLIGNLLLWGEATCVLGAFSLMQRDPIPALLGVVAAQMGYRWEGRRLWFALGCLNAALYAVYLGFVDPVKALAPALLYASLQIFTIMLISTLLRGDRARAQLAEANGALLAMQALLEETVRDRERLRIARDLHDVMGHKLTALQINVQVLQQQAGAATPSAELERVAGLTRELLQETRAIVRQVGDASGIAMTDALRGLGSAFPDSVVEVVVDPELRVRNGEIAGLLLRGAQEGITNALRHGAAQHVRVELRQAGERYTLRVMDDGRGLHGHAAGFGLTQLRERLEARGGTLQVNGLPGRGVELIAEVTEEGTR